MNNIKIVNEIINKLKLTILNELFSKEYIDDVEYIEIIKKLKNESYNDDCGKKSFKKELINMQLEKK